MSTFLHGALCLYSVFVYVVFLSWKKVKWNCELISCARFFTTPWTVTHRFLCPWNSPVKNTGVGCHSFLQGIFPTQGSNLGLLHCGQILYRLSHRKAPNLFIWASSSLSCSMWNLVHWPEIKPRSPHWECIVLATGSPGKSLLSWGLIFKSSYLVIVVQLLSHVWLFITLWTAACQAFLSFTVSQSLLKFMSIEL